jgi:DNA repair protein SbcD/Mre11
VERDITAGGLDYVPIGVFDGPDYVALGHIHGRAALSERVRYSGAPLHYSFSEAGKPRGGWLVELGADGLASVEWLDLPVPRRLTVLTGELEHLLAETEHEEHAGDWVSAVLTDRVRPLDGMRRLQERFAWCAALEHRPAVTSERIAVTYAERVRAKTDTEIVAGFLEHVRNGVGPTGFESAVLAEILAEQAAAEAAA